mmetsp:Transcript_10837/g.24596  ORF Transcript_10837/g.24596 Transcript_10837/m.24596 type:complete len:241 (-) Transcript_10837:225-947(-)
MYGDRADQPIGQAQPGHGNLCHYEPRLRGPLPAARQPEAALPLCSHVSARLGAHCASHAVLPGLPQRRAAQPQSGGSVPPVPRPALAPAPLRLWSARPQERVGVLWQHQACPGCGAGRRRAVSRGAEEGGGDGDHQVLLRLRGPQARRGGHQPALRPARRRLPWRRTALLRERGAPLNRRARGRGADAVGGQGVAGQGDAARADCRDASRSHVRRPVRVWEELGVACAPRGVATSRQRSW